MNQQYAHKTDTVRRHSAVIYSSIGQTHSKGYASVCCPECGEHNLHRIPRRSVDRFFSLFVEIRRFACANPQCNWTGNLRKPSRTVATGGIIGAR